MAILLCPICSKRMVTQKVYDGHMAKAHPDASVEKPLVAPVETPVAPVTPEVPVYVPPVVTPQITLRFSVAVEITINGHQYFGKEVVAPNMETAAEIVRIAREAYGSQVLL